MNEKEIDKIFKINAKPLIISIILLILCGIIFYMAHYFNILKPSDDARPFRDIIKEGKLKKHAYIKINYLQSFAEDDELTYYFAIDNKNYVYIVRLNEQVYNSIVEEYNKNPDNFLYRLDGYNYKLDYDIKELAIEAIDNYEYEFGTKIDSSNFEEYLGNSYLNIGYNPNIEKGSWLILIGFIVSVPTIIMFFTVMHSITKLKKFEKRNDIENIKYEIKKDSTIVYPKEKVFLTEKYIFSKISYRVIEYDEIVWAYKQTTAAAGAMFGLIGALLSFSYIIVRTKDNKERLIAIKHGSQDGLDNIMIKIKSKNDNILIGNTKENRKKYREIKRNKKIEN